MHRCTSPALRRLVAALEADNLESAASSPRVHAMEVDTGKQKRCPESMNEAGVHALGDAKVVHLNQIAASTGVG